LPLFAESNVVLRRTSPAPMRVRSFAKQSIAYEEVLLLLQDSLRAQYNMKNCGARQIKVQ